MFLTIMKYFAYLYACTWFVWPFVFVYSFATGLCGVIKEDEEKRKSLLWAAIALLVITAGSAYS